MSAFQEAFNEALDILRKNLITTLHLDKISQALKWQSLV